MKNSLVIIFFLTSFLGFTQEKETVIIKKATYNLYRGVLAETKSWYLLVDPENNFYLANIDRPNEEIFDWFIKFKDSQNIYKATLLLVNSSTTIGGNQLPTLHFTKENEPTDILNFYIEKPFKDAIVLISIADNTIYNFQLEE